jgi:hypothetical protein
MSVLILGQPQFLILFPVLILFRIWRVDRLNAGLVSQSTASRSAKSPYHNAKRIIIESGLMYTSVATVSASVYISGSNVFAPLTGIVCLSTTFFKSDVFIFHDMQDVQMIGIAFNLILIRVHHNRAAELKLSTVAPDRLPASTLRFDMTPEMSQPTYTVLGDLESNYNLERLEGREQDSDGSTSLSLREKV